jgi:hypothetical protein
MVEENTSMGTMFKKFFNSSKLDILFELGKLELLEDQRRSTKQQESLPKQQE